MKVRNLEDGSVEVFGYVNCTGKKSKLLHENGEEFFEIMQEGVFKNAIKRADDIKVLFNHDDNYELSSTSQGAEIYEDDIGLFCRFKTNDEHVKSQIEHDKIQGWSFRFTNPTYETSGDTKTCTRLELIECSLLDVEPAYSATKAMFRDRDSQPIYERNITGGVDVEADKDLVMEENESQIDEDMTIVNLLQTLIVEVKGLREDLSHKKDEEEREEVNKEEVVEENTTEAPKDEQKETKEETEKENKEDEEAVRSIQNLLSIIEILED
ncbi:MAG: HK97 family phage prohead protease [Clostridium baratii]|nr:HK97 family phage prohead protease [Clostridium baratii]